MRRSFLVASFLLLAVPALAQQPKEPDPAMVQAQLEETQFLLAQRRSQAIAAGAALEQADARLKWVLDNWVAKAPQK